MLEPVEMMENTVSPLICLAIIVQNVSLEMSFSIAVDYGCYGVWWMLTDNGKHGHSFLDECGNKRVRYTVHGRSFTRNIYL